MDEDELVTKMWRAIMEMHTTSLHCWPGKVESGKNTGLYEPAAMKPGKHKDFPNYIK
jgi:hypothetical protein